MHKVRVLVDLGRIKRKPQTVKAFSATRWNGISTVMASAVGNKTEMQAIFTPGKSTSPSQRVLDVDRKGSREESACGIGLNGAFWSGLEAITPYTSLISAVITHLEGDLVAISSVPLPFSLLIEASADKELPPGVSNCLSVSLKKRYAQIASNLHPLALVLDPTIKASWIDAA